MEYLSFWILFKRFEIIILRTTVMIFLYLLLQYYNHKVIFL